MLHPELTPLYLASTIQKLDALTMKHEGISSQKLMDRAVGALWKHMEVHLKSRKSEKVIFLIGPGNNGGDGLGLAHQFQLNGFSVSLFVWQQGTTEEWQYQRAKIDSKSIHPWEECPKEFTGLVIDALFGAGFHNELPDAIQVVTARLRESKAEVWAVDVPSGINGDLGHISANGVRADRTFCIGREKYVLHLPALLPFRGALECVDIGLQNSLPPDVFLLTRAWARKVLPKRKEDSHKGSFGRLQIFGGHRGYSGAGVLAALGAFKSGCGYVSVVSNDPSPIVQAVPEIVTKEITDATATIIGPGYGLEDAKAPQSVSAVLNRTGPLLIDGDGLTLLSQLENRLLNRKNTVITPHPKEMATLLGIATAQVNHDRVRVLKNFGETTAWTVVLKGSGSLIWNNGVMYLNPTGNAGMATAGQGDVLAGMIGAWLAAGLETGVAACLGVFLHGLAGDAVAHQDGKRGILAHEVAQHLPSVLESL